MSDDDLALEMSMPLDSDGFLRRECPTCEREFKWLYTSEEEGTSAPIRMAATSAHIAAFRLRRTLADPCTDRVGPKHGSHAGARANAQEVRERHQEHRAQLGRMLSAEVKYDRPTNWTR